MTTRWLAIATEGLLVTFVELLNRALWIKGACNGMYQIQTSLFSKHHKSLLFIFIQGHVPGLKYSLVLLFSETFI